MLLVFVSQENKCKADSPTSAERYNTTPQSQAKQTLGKMRTNFVRRCKSIKKKVEKLRDKLNCEDHHKNEDEAIQVGRLQLLSIIFLLKMLFYAPQGTSGGILKSRCPSVHPSVTNRVSAISHKLLKQI